MTMLAPLDLGTVGIRRNKGFYALLRRFRRFFGNGHILRIFEPTGRARETVVNLPPLGISQPVSLGAFEVKTLRLFPGAKALVETDMMENPL